MKLIRRKMKRGRVEIIPMIDTIVILLIFYMTFSRFAEANRESNIELPGSRAGDKSSQQENQVVVNMFSTDEVRIGGNGYKAAEIVGLLNRIRQSDRSKTNMSVILRGDKKMTYLDLSDFMKAGAKAGVSDVTFATIDTTSE